MKKLIITAALTTFFYVGYAQTTTDCNQKNTAKVQQIEGYYIFVDSEPTKPYDFIGTVTTSSSKGGIQYTNIRDKLIKNAKEQFPRADALIFRFSSGQADKAEAIKFRE